MTNVKKPVDKVKKDQFDEMNDIQLRKYADLMRVPVTNAMTEDELRSAIRAKQKDRQTVEIAETGTRPKPGWARIEILRDGTPGASNRPVYVNANGYRVTVPRGVEVDVPIKVVRVLNDARSVKVTEDPNEPYNSPRRWRRELLPTYPFQVKDIVEGPDPRPGLEATKIAKQGPREEFRQKFGRYPRKGELLQAQKEGFVSIKGMAAEYDKKEEIEE